MLRRVLGGGAASRLPVPLWLGVLAGVSGVLGLVRPSIADPPGYQCIVLPGTYEANGVNNLGEVVGRTAAYGEPGQAFYYKAGEMRTFGHGSDLTVAHAISDSGHIAGVDYVNDAGRAMMADRDGNVTLLPDGGAFWAEAYAINDQKQAVGYLDGQDGWNRAVRWDDGAFNDISGGHDRNSYAYGISNLGVPVGADNNGACWFDPTPQQMGAPGFYSVATAISDSGHVAGISIDAGVWTAWVWHHLSGFQMIADGPAGSVWISDVNSWGEAVGKANGGAFLWDGSDLHVLSDLIAEGAADLEEARSINDCGVIAGIAAEGGFLLVPMDALDTADADGDGLLDRWERCGIDIDVDGVIDYVPPDADPEHADLYLELDHVASAPIHAEVLDSLVAAFARVPNSDLPVPNPDGEGGITLHFIIDDGDVPEVGDLLLQPPIQLPPVFDLIKEDRFGTAEERALPEPERTRVLDAKRNVYHYGVVIQGLKVEFPDGSVDYASGLAECFGNDFMVAVRGFRYPPGTWQEQAGTIMHELGHNLDLSHGGGDDENYKANYFSVMNYTWQIPHPGFSLDWRLDYSRSDTNPSVFEAILDEQAGLDGITRDGESVAVYVAVNGDPTQVRLVWTDSPSVDFDGDGIIDPAPVSVDINQLDPRLPPTPAGQHHDHDDWASIRFDFRASPAFPEGNHPACPGFGPYELSLSQIERLAEVPPPDPPSSMDPDATLIVEGIEVTPNPFGAQTHLRLQLPEAGPLVVTVFDVAGRVVRVLHDGPHAAGSVALGWDGRDTRGRDVANGLYLARIRTAAETRFVRIVRRK